MAGLGLRPVLGVVRGDEPRHPGARCGVDERGLGVDDDLTQPAERGDHARGVLQGGDQGADAGKVDLDQVDTESLQVLSALGRGSGTDQGAHLRTSSGQGGGDPASEVAGAPGQHDGTAHAAARAAWAPTR